MFRSDLCEEYGYMNESISSFIYTVLGWAVDVVLCVAERCCDWSGPFGCTVGRAAKEMEQTLPLRYPAKMKMSPKYVLSEEGFFSAFQLAGKG